MKYRYLTIILTLLLSTVSVAGMEYGLRFNSHSYPAAKRTSLKLSDTPFEFTDELSVGFDMCFYGKDKFGLICTLTGNDGTKISLVSSSSDDGYRPAIVINNELHTIPVEFDATADYPVRPIIVLKRHENRVVFIYNKARYSFPVTLNEMSSATIYFGKNETQESIAPIEIQDVRVYTEKKNTHKWELRTHDGDSSIDDLSRTYAHATNPHWILDDHVAWTDIYQLKTNDKIQTAFDVKDNTFFIVSETAINIFNPQQNTNESFPVKQDGRVMKYSNYLTYDTITDQLLSYNFADKDVSRFDFVTKSWSNATGSDNEPRFANHAIATDGNYAYMFGGYGFYLYHNNLFRLDLRRDIFEEITLQPLPEPRTSVAMCIYENRLYLFGGKGNTVGKQEIPSEEYYDLWEYDLTTFKGRKVWEIDSVKHNFLPSSTMYYVPKDSAFYAASTIYGGSMIRISINRPEFKIVSEPIHAQMDYRDCVFNLYQSLDKKAYYLVIDKRLDDFSHDYSIYQICYPFGDELLYENYIPTGSKLNNRWIYWIIAILILAAIAVVSIRFHKKRAVKSNYDEPQLSIDDSHKEDNQSKEADNTATTELDSAAETDKGLIIERISPSTSAHFKREKSSISFLGKFEIKDKNGEDITPKFTSRVKDLLIMLILYSEKDEKGISYQKIDEEIWFDKDEKSAKNNRNVYMRKLRVLLEETGDIEIVYDKGYYRINNNGVFVDYHESMTRLKQEGLTGKALEETIELLLFGPLLPNTVYPWLDSFKSQYTDTSLQVLYKLMEHEQQRKGADESLAYRIAETISRHDALSEEALSTMCRILYNRRMKGPAKNLYDSFCKEYAKSFGEEYNIPFSQIFNA